MRCLTIWKITIQDKALKAKGQKSLSKEQEEWSIDVLEHTLMTQTNLWDVYLRKVHEENQ